MAYAVKEIFYTLQGEGVHSGRAAVFCRFAGCNLWNGRESDRATSICTFCDTDFVGTDGEGGGKFASASDGKYMHGICSFSARFLKHCPNCPDAPKTTMLPIILI